MVLGAICSTAISQVPRGFNYQAIARDGEGTILSETNLKIRIGILQTVSPDILLWEEEHLKTTDKFGLFQLIVGDPEVSQSGGSLGDFAEINWLNQPLYLRTQIYFKGAWIPMGDAQLYSVPYSYVAGSLSGTLPELNIQGVVTDPNEPLFEVKNKGGQTIFAVYSEGVRVYVSDGDAKGLKGGFAVGGFDNTKGNQEYLRVTSDSTRIYVNDDPAKGIKGGFAVGGFDASKGTLLGNFLNITKENYLIGQEAGIKLKPLNGGLYNSFLGYQAGINTTTGYKNYFIGYKAGYSNTTGFSNTFIGDSAGFKNTVGVYNTFMGNWAGYNNQGGYKNVFIGHRTGYSNTSGICNVFLGPDAGGKNTTAWYNTFVGIGAGYKTTWGGYNSYYGINSGYAMTSGVNNAFYGSNSGYWFDGGSGNTFIGAEAGRGGPDDDPADPAGDYNTLIGSFTSTNLENAYRNTIVGAFAGASMRTGTNNVFLGYQAGYSETGSNKLYVANSSTNPLIYGDLSTKQLGINTTTLTSTLNVGGTATITGALSAGSVTAPLTGDVTGDVIGNVTGNVTGNLTGKVNGIGTGSIFMQEEGTIQYIDVGPVVLYYIPAAKIILLDNKSHDFPCNFWYRIIDGASAITKSGEIAPTGVQIIIEDEIKNNTGFEIHFNQITGSKESCSTWFQHFGGTLSGHYLKF
jgi:hypothetical protein